MGGHETSSHVGLVLVGMWHASQVGQAFNHAAVVWVGSAFIGHEAAG